jgi:hypothetical protein
MTKPIVGQALRLPSQRMATDAVALQFIFCHSERSRGISKYF